MKSPLLFIIVTLELAGCGVIVPYVYDSQKLHDRLTVAMSKEQVLDQLGKPDRVVQDGEHDTILEYRLYPKGEWAAYLIHCPIFPNCYFPAEAGHPYYVVLHDKQLCMWGTPHVVMPLIKLACGNASQLDRKEHMRGGLRISMVPLFMPPPISPIPQRLAVVAVDGFVDNMVNSWLDLTLNFLRTRHRELILVEREDLRTVLTEVGIQYGGQVDDDTTIRVGRLLGADTLLVYRLLLSADNPRAAAFELRLLTIESGTTVFRQMASASLDAGTASERRYRIEDNSFFRRLILEEAAAYGLAALTAAFGDNPLGIISDYTWIGEGIKVIDVLQGGPGFRAGLRPGDHILECNRTQLISWSDPVSLPAHLTVRRDGTSLEMNVR